MRALSSAALLGAVAATVACDDRAAGPTSPPAPLFGTANGTIRVLGQPSSTFTFRGDVIAAGDGSTWSALRNLTVERQRVLTADLGRTAAASAAADKIVGSTVKSRKYHFKDRDGRINSLAIVDGADPRHPKAAYQFVGTSIKLVASFAYDLAGRPRDVLYTVFGDDGKPTVQVRQAFTARVTSAAQPLAGRSRVPWELGARAGQILANVALPTPLYAMDDDGGCLREWLRYTLASADFADASAQIAKCANTGACGPGVVVLIANLTAATSELNASFNALAACQDKAANSGSSTNGSDGGGTPGGGGSIDEAIDQFINSAGTVEFCNAVGDDCVYILQD